MKGLGASRWSRSDWLLVAAVVVLAGLVGHGFLAGRSPLESSFAKIGFGELAIIFTLVIVFLGPKNNGRR
jgi:hypothetical protein